MNFFLTCNYQYAFKDLLHYLVYTSNDNLNRFAERYFMLRVGEPIRRNIKYHYRPSIYGLIIVGKSMLLTQQNGNEIQLPGGGIDKGEHYLHALIREVYEETGWKIKPERRLGFFQRYVYMPEYNKWAHKVSHIHLCRGIYQVSLPTEKEHIAKLEKPEIAARLVESPGDSFFINRFFGLTSSS